MGRNFQGGNKQKAMANKSNTISEDHLRLINDDCEKYAIITKVFGGGICEAHYLDQQYDSDDNILHIPTKIIVHIRGKMKGHSKRNNLVQLRSFVLIGIRDYSSKPIADILHVYNQFHADLLLDNVNHFNIIYNL